MNPISRNKNTVIVIVVIVAVLMFALPTSTGQALTPNGDVETASQKTMMATWTGEKTPDWASLGYEVVIDYGNSAMVKVDETIEGNAPRKVTLNEIDSMEKISTDAAEFDPEKVEMGTNDDGLHLIQMEGPVKARWLDKMKNKGIEPISYLPHNSYLVELEDKTKLESMNFVRAVESYGPSLRVHPDLTNKDKDVRSANILVKPDSRASELLPSYLDEYEFSFSLGSLDVYHTQVKTYKIQKIRELSGLVWMEPFIKPTLNDERAVELVGGSFEGSGAYVNDLGFTGEGVKVAVVDSGIDDGKTSTMHPDLKGRIEDFLPYGYASDAADGLGHGTHCAGIIAGNAATERTDSKGYYYGSGVAPEAELVAQKIFRDSGSFVDPNMDKLASEAVNSSVLVSSNSWGAATGGGYNAMSAAFDRYTRDANVYENGSQPLTYVFSAGNSGPEAQTIGAPGTAKNVITVGASENNRPELGYYNSDNPEEIAAFSSRGPTVDGRIKPDITAPGTWISSALSSSAPKGWAQGSPDGKYYEWASGTSMAAPHVSGGAALFGQFYQQTYNERPTPSLIKAALINGAVNLEGGRFGGKSPVPNNDEGWGLMNLTNTLPTDETVDYLNRDVRLETGDVYTKNVEVTGDKPLKITMAYSDVAAAPNANPTLVNNLNLIVKGPNGKTYVGNAFSNGWSDPSLKYTDNLNNLENVFIKDPTEGSYTVTVHGASVPQDAIDSTSEVDQDFSLVVRGEFNGQSVGNIKVDKQYYEPGETLNIELFDSDLNKDPNSVEEVTVSVSSGKPDGENVILTETGVDDHVFTGSIELENSIAHMDDGILQVNKVDEIEVVYNDNNPYGRRVTSAVVDSVSPVISDTKVMNPRPQKINVSWNTDELTTGKIYYKPIEADSWDVYQEGRAKEHKVVLDDLERNMPYELYISAKDKAGNEAIDDNDGEYYTFKTKKPAPVLIVDDGGEGWSGKYDYQKYLEWALDNTSFEYEVWDYIDKGTPSVSDLRVRDVVIWHTGRDSIGTLNSEDEQVLSDYLDHNGKLFLNAPKYLRDVGLTPFAKEYLQVDSYSYPRDLSYNVTGVNGDPITDKIGKLNISFPYSKYFAETGHIWPNSNGSTIFNTWFEEPTAIRTNNSKLPYRSVFFSFPFEAIHYDDGNNGSMVMNNVMDWLTIEQDHDLQVQGLEVSKEWAKPGENVGIKASIFNNGNTEEKDVQVNIKIDETVVKSQTISSLDVGQSKFVSTNITAQGDGEKSITVDISPVKYENETADNKWSEPLFVRSPQDPIKVVVVDSLGNYRRWGDIESQWYKYSNHPFEFDTKSLTHQGITYSDITETNADMLYISDAWDYHYGWEFSDSEVDAISDYVSAGHPIIATAGTFNYDLAPNNQELAPIFGLKEDAHGSWGFGDELKNPFTVTDPDHPMFDGIPESYMPGDPSAASGLRVSDGHIKAKSLSSSWIGPDTKYYIVTNKHENGQAFYFSHFPESGDASAQDKRLICNSLVYGYQNSTTPEHDITVRKQKVPEWVEYGAQAKFKARVYNTGSNTETDIQINLNIDGTVRDTKTISTLNEGDQKDVTLKYTPADHGEHAVKINSTKLNGETITINNNVTEVTYVRTYQGELTVAPVDCYANEFVGPMGVMEEIEGEWYKYGNYSLNFDLDTLHSWEGHYQVTYDKLVRSKADVLLLSNNGGFDTYKFSNSEVSAIENYTKDGGAVVATGDTFKGTKKTNNNTKMLDLFGLTHGSFYKDYLYVDDGAAINLTKPNHPVFKDVNDPYQPGPVIKKDYTGEYMPGTKTEVASDIGVGDARILANTTLRSGRILNITEHKSGLGQTVYSDYSLLHNGRKGYTPDQDKQFFYNMLKFAYQNTTFTPGVSHEPYEYASTGKKIPVNANIFDKDDGIKSATLYYKNVGESSYSSKSMTITSGDINDGTWSAEIPAQSSGGEVEYYIKAEDQSGHVTKMPHGPPSDNYTTMIDVDSPVIRHTSPDEGLIGQQVPITAQVREESTLSSVMINYENVNGDQHSEYMIYSGGDNFTAYLPAQDSLGQITYAITATDINGNKKTTEEYQIDVTGHLLTVNVVDRDGDPISPLTGDLMNERTGESIEITTSSDGSYEYPLTNLDAGYKTGDRITAKFNLNGEKATSSITIDDMNGSTSLTVKFDQEVIDSESPTIVDKNDEVAETDTTYTIKAEITDNREISEVYVKYWTDVTDKINRTMPSSGSTYELTINIPADAEKLSYEISAVDESGNWRKVERLDLEVTDVISPTAEIRADQNVGVGKRISINANGSSDNIGIKNYTWNIDGERLFGETVSYTFEEVGSHEVVLTVKDADGNKDESTITVQVEDLQAPTADAGTDMTVETSETFKFNASGSSDNLEITSYRWIVEGEVLTGLNPEYSFEKPGEYAVTLRVSDEAGNTATDKILVTVNDAEKPTADAGSGLTIGLGEKVMLDASGSTDNLGIVSYLWSIEGEKLNGEVVSVSFDHVGTYEATLTVKDSAGNTAKDSIMVKVVDKVKPEAKAEEINVVKEGKTITLSASDSTDNVGIEEYKWSIDGGEETFTGQSVEYTFNTSGKHEVSLTVVDGSGNKDTTSFTVQVETKEKAGETPAGKTMLDLWWLVPMAILAGGLIYLLWERDHITNSNRENEESSEEVEEVIDDEEENIEDDEVFEDWEK